MHGAGDFVDRRGCLHADLGGVVRSAGYLIRAAGDLRSAVANVPHQVAQTESHFAERMAERVTFGTRVDLHRKIASGDGFRVGGHLAQVEHHAVEGERKLGDFVFTFDFDLLLQVPSFCNLTGNADELVQRTCDRSAHTEGNCYADHHHKDDAYRSHHKNNQTRGLV